MRIRRTAVLRLNAEHTKNISVLSHAPDIRFFAMQTNETIWIHKRLVLTQILSSPLCRRRRMTRMPPTRSRGLTCGKGSGKLRGFLSLPYICLLRALTKLKAKKDRAHLVLGPAMLAQYLIVKMYCILNTCVDGWDDQDSSKERTTDRPVPWLDLKKVMN